MATLVVGLVALAGRGLLFLVLGPLVLKVAVVRSSAAWAVFELLFWTTTTLEAPVEASGVSRVRMAPSTWVAASIRLVGTVEVQVLGLGQNPPFLALKLHLRNARVERLVGEVLFFVFLEAFQSLLAVVVEQVLAETIRLKQTDTSELILRLELHRRIEHQFVLTHGITFYDQHVDFFFLTSLMKLSDRCLRIVS